MAHLRVEVHDDGLHAESTAMDGYPTGGAGDLAAFMRQLADDWRGRAGESGMLSSMR